MKEKILDLRNEGKSYNEISTILGCSKGVISYHCNPKVKAKALAKQKVRRRKIMTDLINYKGGQCIKCGYSKCSAALEFHHRDPKSKSFSISDKRCNNFADLKKEADKCDLLCSNCHKEFHSMVE